MGEITRTITMDEDLWRRIIAEVGPRNGSRFFRDAAELRLSLRKLGVPDRLDSLIGFLRLQGVPLPAEEPASPPPARKSRKSRGAPK